MTCIFSILQRIYLLLLFCRAVVCIADSGIVFIFSLIFRYDELFLLSCLVERLVVSLGRLRSEKKLAAKAMNTQCCVRQEATGHSLSRQSSPYIDRQFYDTMRNHYYYGCWCWCCYTY